MNILAISGRKQAGKDTCYQFIKRFVPGAHQFYFAEPLKRMCIDILGCPKELVYGSDADKNTPIPHLLWENFPVRVWDPTPSFQEDIPIGVGVFVGEPNWSTGDRARVPPQHYYRSLSGEGDEISLHNGVFYKRKTGPMTVREVLQYWGTEIFRHAYHNVWADACIRSIKNSPATQLAVVTDCRFANEVDAVQFAGGKVLRLTRVISPNDTHVSEIALDRDRFDWARFNCVLDNEKMDVEMQCIALYQVLHAWGWVPDLELRDLVYYAHQTMAEYQPREY